MNNGYTMVRVRLRYTMAIYLVLQHQVSPLYVQQRVTVYMFIVFTQESVAIPWQRVSVYMFIVLTQESVAIAWQRVTVYMFTVPTQESVAIAWQRVTVYMFIALTQESVAIAWSKAVSLSQQQKEKIRELFECMLDIHSPILRSSQKLITLATFPIHLCAKSAYIIMQPPLHSLPCRSD